MQGRVSTGFWNDMSNQHAVMTSISKQLRTLILSGMLIPHRDYKAR